MKTNIIEHFEETVATFPEKTAIIDGERHVTFRELRKKALAISHALSNTEVSNRPIAVYLSKSAETVVADLGIIYSGNAFMNLDVSIPHERIRRILENVAPPLILTTRKLYDHIFKIRLKEQIILCMEEILAQPDAMEESSNIVSCTADSKMFCIINTSGSTGTPKGVVLHQRGFLDYTRWAIDTFSLSHEEVLGVLSPVVFDHYVYEICLLFIHGVSLLLIPPSLSAFPVKILGLLKTHSVSFIFWVPTIMVNIANMKLFDEAVPPPLKTIWFAGEVFPTRQFNYWRAAFPTAIFVNLYGPTEITVDCTYYKIERELANDEPIPIGFPRKNVDILILNGSNELAKTGEEGELCVLGSSLALGYYNAPEKTAEVFVQNPLNGCYPEIIYRTGDIVYVNDYGEIVFKGRKDTLIKHQGYRIELAEIEHAAISAVAEVRNCCVFYRDKKIVLFYEARVTLDEKSLRLRLGETLPRYMLPTEYIHLSEMPRNVNGKIDRFTLKETLPLHDRMHTPGR
ncbi:MAG: amino acid adenylation domain-containing protein [Candidatus Accumulibacter sp.]|jgi:amino acid adenylation domain-containing protein|nr:amino acid adenylation domain-containing protein [Accumulibacter sp.]